MPLTSSSSRGVHCMRWLLMTVRRTRISITGCRWLNCSALEAPWSSFKTRSKAGAVTSISAACEHASKICAGRTQWIWRITAGSKS